MSQQHVLRYKMVAAKTGKLSYDPTKQSGEGSYQAALDQLNAMREGAEKLGLFITDDKREPGVDRPKKAAATGADQQQADQAAQ